MHSTAHSVRALRFVTVVLVAAWSPLLAVRTTATGAPQGSDPVGEWPLRPEPELVTAFDPPAGPYSAGHRGVDLLGSAGQVVHAALAGTVSYAAPLAGRGVVVVTHQATRTTYEPVTAAVSRGDTVAAGTPIGTLQLPGSHCFPRACLHWGWIEGAETYLDPLRLVGFGPVRLLPLWRDLPATPAPPVAPVAPVAPRSNDAVAAAAFRAPLQGVLDLFGDG